MLDYWPSGKGNRKQGGSVEAVTRKPRDGWPMRQALALSAHLRFERQSWLEPKPAH